ncbi:MAG: extracellular solute-binding protein [Spirochaetales bacterium]|nr:extracellular solute-binding protein [Spirochaetales bacterium]
MYKNKKQLISMVIACLVVLAATGGTTSEIAAENKGIVLSIWSYTDEIKKFIDRFEYIYRGIDIKLTIVPCEEYLQKLKHVLKFGTGVPDVFLGEYSHIKDIVESGYWEDLSRAPFKADVSDMFPYLVEVGTDSNGKLRGLSWQVTPGGFYYRRSVAKQYLGTDDPQKIGNMISTPQKLLDTARLLKKKSDGKVKLIAGHNDYMHYICAARKKSFVSEKNELYIENSVLDYFDLAKTMSKEGLTAASDQWGWPWFENMNKKDPYFMGYFLPPWGLQYVIKPNARDTYGDWGMARGPGSFFWGGSWLGICSQSINKNAAWEFLKYVTLKHDTLEWWAKETGDVVSSKSVCNKVKKDFKDDFLGGQNAYEFFTQEALKLKGSLMTKHNLEVRNYMMDILNAYVEGSLNRQEALTQWREEVEIYLSEYEEWKNPNEGKTEGALGDFDAEQCKKGGYETWDGESTTLSVWTFTDEMKKWIDEFEMLNPDIEIDLTIVPCEDYLHKLRPVLRSGRNAPDVFAAEYANVVDLVESGFYEDLGKAPYKADISDVFPYIVEVGTDSGGRLRALSWQAVPGGILYRRSVAEQYLGTADPEKIGRMLSTPEKFLATARKLNEKSGGRVKLIAGYGDYQHFPLALRKKAFVANGRLNIERCILDYFEMAKIMRDEELTAEIGTWSSPWFENMNEENPEFLCYVLPTWGLHYVIKPNGRDTVGDWGLCEGPAAYFWGGTWVGIYKNSENKQAAWKFVKFMTQEHESLEWWAMETGDFVSNKAVVNKIKQDFADQQLGGQNHYAFYARLADKIDGSLLKKYDLDIRGFLMGAINNYVEGMMTKEEAIEQFKADVENAFPDIRVE